MIYQKKEKKNIASLFANKILLFTYNFWFSKFKLFTDTNEL